ncbi:MAG: hypothetical protein MMC33_006967 [Icmadophila ericetorum]|nr:hypothetical protein [Icmadophila ericetorum]
MVDLGETHTNMEDTSSTEGLLEKYDYIVIGGGTAGLAVAARLTEDFNVRVLVLEAGANHMANPRVTIPGLALSTWSDPELDYCFKTIPQEHLGDRIVAQPRGKVLGGCSAINIGMMTYPSRFGMDGWAELGNPSWNFDSLAPYYRKFHTFISPSKETREQLGLDYLDDKTQGMSGPVQVSYGEEIDPLSKAWPATFQNLNLKMRSDPLTGETIGAQSNPAAVDPKTKTRSYAASAYYSLEIAKRPNLRVLTEAQAEKILLEKRGGIVSAKGVQFTTRSGDIRYIYARNEVILSAGVIKSPQLLEVSGIGSARLLQSHCIKVMIDNPYVGENLQDHVAAHLSLEMADGLMSVDMLREPGIMDAIMSLYINSKSGPLAQGTFSSAFTPMMDFLDISRKAELVRMLDEILGNVKNGSHPALTKQHSLIKNILLRENDSSSQYFAAPFQLNSHEGPDPQEHLKPTTPGNYLTIFVALSHPFSRGSVHINSADPNVAPTIDPKYFSHPLDIEILARHVQFFETIAKTEPFSTLLKPNGRRIPVDTHVEDLATAKELSKLLISNYHPTGTCAMMPRDMGGVVNERLIVHGTTNLRVVDASIMPMIPRGNIQSSVYAIAERAADIIKQDRILSEQAASAADIIKQDLSCGMQTLSAEQASGLDTAVH